jgi:hypothetical protein
MRFSECNLPISEGMNLRWSIRDLFWLTVVVAILIAWRLDHLDADRLIVQDYRQLTEVRSRLEGYVEYLDSLKTESSQN